MQYLTELSYYIYNINGLCPISNAKLTNILGLNCKSRSGYITHGIINNNIMQYTSNHKYNIVTNYNSINEIITHENKNDFYNYYIQNCKLIKTKFIYFLYKLISQQKNKYIRQCYIKNYIDNFPSELNNNDNFIFNFCQLMIESNMLIDYKDGLAKYYKLGPQCEYLEPIINYNMNYKYKGESMIADYLEKQQIEFTFQKRFKDCRYKKCLPFDFYIKYKDIDILIEYNGIQHIKPVSLFGGIIGFEERQRNDQIKKEYAENNNIKLIIIDHTINTPNTIKIFLDKELSKL